MKINKTLTAFLLIGFTIMFIMLTGLPERADIINSDVELIKKEITPIEAIQTQREIIKIIYEEDVINNCKIVCEDTCEREQRCKNICQRCETDTNFIF